MKSALAEQGVGVYESTQKKLSEINPFILIGASVAGTWLFFRIRDLYRRYDKPLHKRLFAYSFTLARKIPAIEDKIQQNLEKSKLDLVNSIHECDSGKDFIEDLPPEPFSVENLFARIHDYEKMGGRFDYLRGRVSGAVYTNMEPAHMRVLGEVFHKFAFSNPLHPDIFPAVRKMEAEVVRIVANLFSGPPGAAGTMTSGGTESIILACLSSRNFARARGISSPVMIVPVTAHAAFDKACQLLGIRIRHVRCDPATGKVDLKAMKWAIDGNTCLLVGSAPNFPYGSVDDIQAIAKMGLSYRIPVHVDACLGGFLLAFAQDVPALNHVPIFDFRLPGVTSISCDTHKYGYAPKGTSVIIYRSSELLHHQYMTVTEWPGGIYATPTLSGSRAGLNIALTWATLMHFGRDEYVRRAQLIVSAAATLAVAIIKIPGLFVVGSPEVSVVAFSSNDFNIHAVGDRLNKLGWNLNALQLPDALHFCLTYNQSNGNAIDDFVIDLRQACKEVTELPDQGKGSKTAAIYGMAAKIPDKTIVEEVAHLYLDACYSMPPDQ